MLTEASIKHRSLILRAGSSVAASIWVEEADYIEERDWRSVLASVYIQLPTSYDTATRVVYKGIHGGLTKRSCISHQMRPIRQKHNHREIVAEQELPNPSEEEQNAPEPDRRARSRDCEAAGTLPAHYIEYISMANNIHRNQYHFIVCG